MVKQIVLAKIYFTDLTSFKLRPILLIKKYRDEDFLFLPLTTNLKIRGIKITADDLSHGKLKAPSVVIHPKIHTIHKSLFVKKIGELKTEVFNKILKELCTELGCPDGN